jgi:parallel beta-helix repeat protein
MFRKPILQGVLLLAWLLAALSAQAGVVTSLADSGPGSLRQVMADASPGDTITFAVTGTITLTSGPLPIADNGLSNTITITGPGADLLTIQRDPNSEDNFDVFDMLGDVAATIQGVTISHGASLDPNSGGGITLFRSTLTLNNCILSNNSGDEPEHHVAGGGISNESGTLILNNCTLSNNFGGAGGGILNLGGTTTLNNCTLSNNSVSSIHGGGSILSLSGTVTLTNCTLSNNSVSMNGGGIFSASTKLTLTNCTLSGNSAGNEGGGIYNANSSNAVALSNCTLVGNSAGTSGGGIYNNAGTVNSKNSIIANNPVGGNYAGAVQLLVAGVNFSDDATVPGFTQVSLAQLNLGSFDYYGGPTPTIPLLFPSVAIDAASDGTDWFGNPVPTDQRGVARPQRSQFDVGAFEYQNLAPLVNAGGNQTVTATHSGNPATDTASLTLNGSATDPENDPITFTWTDSTNTVVGNNASLNLTLAPGNYTYTLTAADPFGGHTSQSVQVTVNPAPNQAPTANAQSLTTNSNTAKPITLTGSDPDSDALSYALKSGPSHGSLSGTAPNLTYIPNNGYAGMDSFTFTATDPYGASSSATVSLSVVVVPKVTVKLTAIGQLLGIVGIVVTINNSGSVTATNVKLTSASLIGVDALLAVPNNGFTLGAGKSADEALVFFPLKKGQKGTLSITGSYSGGTFSLSQAVTIP